MLSLRNMNQIFRHFANALATEGLKPFIANKLLRIGNSVYNNVADIYLSRSCKVWQPLKMDLNKVLHWYINKE